MSDPINRTVARHVAGSANKDELNKAIDDAWCELLQNKNDRAAVAKILGVDDNQLDPSVVPFEAEISKSGLTGGEVVVAFVSAFMIKLATELGEDAAKLVAHKLRIIWADYMRRRVSPLGDSKLGNLKDNNSE